MKKWKIQNKLKVENGKLKITDLITVLLGNRGITTKKEKETFLHPKLTDVTPKSVGISAAHLKKTIARIQKAIENKEQIIVFGDYDVDGITGTAILWETLHAMGANVLPYIPNRIDEGYGLSTIGIKNCMEKILRLAPLVQNDKGGLMITVDNGIVAHEAVDFANEQGIDVILTDHHVADATLPNAFSIVHTTKLCGAGVAWVLAKELKKLSFDSSADSLRMTQKVDSHLELAALGTVADMVPLTGANRAIVAHGLEKVRLTKRPGLQALYQQAGLNKEQFAPYDIGFVIAPRLNASGRIASAMDSLRLLCTKRKERAEELASKLEVTNRERQQLLKDATEHAIAGVRGEGLGDRKLLIATHESYQEGVIGLVAGRLVEAFYRPSIVIARREKKSKASVRSVSGFNIIAFLRSHKELFINVGGHPMAAGFTIETEKIAFVQQLLEEKAADIVTDETLTRTLAIDCELPFSAITEKFYQELQQLGPFGIGNPEPVFATKKVTIQDIRMLGREGKHLKLRLQQSTTNNQQQIQFDAIAFGMGERAAELHVGDTIAVAYTIDENVWNGRVSMQLKVKDMKY